MVEGESEKIFLDSVRNFLQPRCPARAMPKLIPLLLHSNVPKRNELIKLVRNELKAGSNAVIVLTDVKGQNSFNDAQDVIARIESSLTGLPSLNTQVFVHAAQRPKPSKTPEQINNLNRPSKLLSELWRTGGRKSKSYNKVLHLHKILEGQDLEHASEECPTLKSFLNRLLTLSGAPTL